jgi:hypothetical protein
MNARNGREVNRARGPFPACFRLPAERHGIVVNSWRKDKEPMDPIVVTVMDELQELKIPALK